MKNKISRNDICYCGSNTKYKKCCYNKDNDLKKQSIVINRKNWKPIIDNHMEKVWRFDLHDKLHELGSNYLDNKSESYWDEIYSVCDEIIENILKHKVEIYNFLEDNKKRSYDNIKGSFQQFILLPYLMYGNKHIKHFEEYSRFISQFNFPSKLEKDEEEDNDVVLFRCMDEEEYYYLKNGGLNVSLSYTSNPSIPVSFQYISTLLDLNKKNIIVGCVYNSKDIIYSVDEGTLSGEGEKIVRIGSQPKIIEHLIEIGKDELVEEFGEDILNFLPLKPNEISNGYNYIDSLMTKGFKWNGIKTERSNQYKGNRSNTHLTYENNVSSFIHNLFTITKEN
jgi:hypothetical protein